VFRRRERPRFFPAIHALVFAGRHAGDQDRAALRRARQNYRLDVTQTIPPTPNQPSKQPMVIPLAVGLVGEAAPICRSRWTAARCRAA